MQNFKESFGSNIHNLRKSRRLTIEALAEMVDVSSRQITRIESGNNFPSAETICKLCIALKVESRDLFDIEWYDDLMYYSTGNAEKPTIKVVKDGEKATVTLLLSDKPIKRIMPISQVISFIVNLTKSKKMPLIVEVFEKKCRTRILKIFPNNHIEPILSVEDLEKKKELNKTYEYILNKIKMFKTDSKKLDYVKLSIEALEDKEALEKIKAIQQGIELTN